MPKQQGARGIGKKVDSSETSPLSDIGISYDQSSQWQRLASVPEETFEKKIAEAKDSDEPLSLRRILSKKEVISFSGEYEWYTPEIYLEMAKEVMGSIDTDPASSKIANKRVKAETFYTQSQNGLTKDWLGNVFLNPPYCMPEIEQFLNKLLAEYAKGNVKQAIVLTNNSTDTNWWQGLAGAAGICFPSHRIQFIAEDGKTKSSPLRGQTFFHLGKSHDTFHKVFGDIGIVF
jgi:ParB family chromosome partitioning protein